MNERQYFTAKGAADAVGCCTATLRNYERAGLLMPARDTAGRRVYTEDDVARARKIKAERAESMRRGLDEGRRLAHA